MNRRPQVTASPQVRWRGWCARLPALGRDALKREVKDTHTSGCRSGKQQVAPGRSRTSLAGPLPVCSYLAPTQASDCESGQWTWQSPGPTCRFAEEARQGRLLSGAAKGVPTPTLHVRFSAPCFLPTVDPTCDLHHSTDGPRLCRSVAPSLAHAQPGGRLVPASPGHQGLCECSYHTA